MAKNKTKKRNTSSSRFRRLGLSYVGLVIAVVFLCFSLTPSLMPRPSFYQGLISGTSMAIGYLIGVLLSKFIRWTFTVRVSPRTRTGAWRVLVFGGGALVFIFFALANTWQKEVRELLGIYNVDQTYGLRVALLSVVIFVLLLGVGRLVARFARFINRHISKYLPQKVSMAFSVIIVFGLGLVLFNGVFLTLFTDVTNSIYSSTNNETVEGAVQPTTSNRSGGPGSYAAWDTLGRQGRGIVGRGPTTEQLSSFSGSPALEPIRVYVGVQTAETAEQRAEIALAELERTGAFDREILVLANATGTGWLEPQAIDSLEYMYNGNSAIATIQYSYLPSWISFLVDQQNATDAGRALFDEVYSYWATLPKETRPKLVTYGLSLGSFSGNSAFTSVADIRNSVDGALFVGTPSSTELWGNITKNRDKGSLEILPVYEGGKTVRFASNEEQIVSDQESWTFPRVLYMQHASDPVVWFDFDLFWNMSDWLREPRGSDVSSRMYWYPIVTFWQVTVDQFFGVTVPNGHGHNYPDTSVAAWAAIAEPADWSPDKSVRLQSLINTYSNE
jgi:uncharacterized membrane protein